MTSGASAHVEKKIEKLQKNHMIEKLDKYTNDYFIAPIVITAKKDGSIKLALDAKPINAQIFLKQIPNANRRRSHG